MSMTGSARRMIALIIRKWNRIIKRMGHWSLLCSSMASQLHSVEC